MNDPEQAARLFKLFSVAARVQIVQLLEERVLCVGALAARLDVTSAAVSQHLRILRNAGLVEREKRGNYAHYRINRDRLKECRQVIAEVLTPPAEEAESCVAEKDAAASNRRS